MLAELDRVKPDLLEQAEGKTNAFPLLSLIECARKHFFPVIVHVDGDPSTTRNVCQGLVRLARTSREHTQAAMLTTVLPPHVLGVSAIFQRSRMSRVAMVAVFMVFGAIAMPSFGQAQPLSPDEAKPIALDSYIYGYSLAITEVTRVQMTNVPQTEGLRGPMK